MRCRSSWDYYQRHLRENFIAHDDEVDPARLVVIFQRARQDADYLIDKVGMLPATAGTVRITPVHGCMHGAPAAMDVLIPAQYTKDQPGRRGH